MLIAVVYNPTKITQAKLEPVLQRVLDTLESEAELRWYETDAASCGRQQTRQAIADGADSLLVAGGDGTVRAVAGELAGSTIPLGLLPVGSGNLLARNLGLPLSLPAAASVAIAGQRRGVDVGLVELRRGGGETERHSFLVMAGLGLDAEMIANTNPTLKRRFGWIAYIDGGIRSLKNLRQVQLAYRIGNRKERSITVHSLLIGNCGLLPANVQLMPGALIDDGVLDIVAMRPKGATGWLRLIGAMLLRGLFSSKRVSPAGQRITTEDGEVRTLRHWRARGMLVRSAVPVAFELDGECLGTVVELRTWLQPRALTVRTGSGDLAALTPLPVLQQSGPAASRALR